MGNAHGGLGRNIACHRCLLGDNRVRSFRADAHGTREKEESFRTTVNSLRAVARSGPRMGACARAFAMHHSYRAGRSRRSHSKARSTAEDFAVTRSAARSSLRSGGVEGDSTLLARSRQHLPRRIHHDENDVRDEVARPVAGACRALPAPPPCPSCGSVTSSASCGRPRARSS